MGVVGLFATLHTCAEPTKLRALRGKRVALDFSCWLVPFMCVASHWNGSTTTAWMRILFFVVTRVLAAGIRPIAVLDHTGRRRDGLHKRGRAKKRGGAFATACTLAADLLEAMGVECLHAPNGVEAEKLCVALERQGAVDIVASDDSDVFAYGAKCVVKASELRELVQADDARGERCVGLYRSAQLARSLGIGGQRDFVSVALLCGCDFGKGVVGVGIAKALAFARDVAARATSTEVDDALALVLNPPLADDAEDVRANGLQSSSVRLLRRCSASECCLVAFDCGTLSVHHLRRHIATEFTAPLPLLSRSAPPSPNAARLVDIMRAHTTMEPLRIVTLALPALALSALRSPREGSVVVTALDVPPSSTGSATVNAHVRICGRTPWRPEALLPLTPRCVDTTRVIALHRDVVALWVPRSSTLWCRNEAVSAELIDTPCLSPASRGARAQDDALAAEVQGGGASSAASVVSPLSQALTPRVETMSERDLLELMAHYGLKAASLRAMRITLADLWRRAREEKQPPPPPPPRPPRAPRSPSARNALSAAPPTPPCAERTAPGATASPMSQPNCPEFLSMATVELAATMKRYGLRQSSTKQMRIALTDLWRRVRNDHRIETELLSTRAES